MSDTVYNVNGNVIRSTTPDGMVTDTVYDAQGRAIYTDDPHLPGKPANGTHTIYDQTSNVTGTEELANVVITVTTVSGVSSSALTSAGAILSTTSTSHDAAGRVAQTVDASGMITNNTYDNVGNLTATTEIVNGVSRTTTSVYNALGQVTSTTDALGNRTQYQYNGAGQVTLTTFADGSTIVDRYDTQGNKIAEIDQNEVETDYQYNQFGELTAVVEPSVTNPVNGQSVNPTYLYAYDIYGDQISTTDALGRVTQYGFDQFGHMVSETLPGTQTETWVYNPLGEMTSSTDFDGNVTHYGYDGLGRLTTKTIYAFSNLTTPYETVTYAYNINYDAQGDYHDTVTDSLDGVTDSEYDVNGRLIKLTSPQGTINYAYDPATGAETEVSTSNTDTHYGYDQADEMTSVTVTRLDGATPLASPLVTGYAYNLDGELASTRTPMARPRRDLTIN
jgi:YD repeat-containing protein